MREDNLLNTRMRNILSKEGRIKTEQRDILTETYLKLN